ncbi:MAG TPA: hypothetical protein VGJ77_10265, partial [Gaiellaceae bacterium]
MIAFRSPPLVEPLPQLALAGASFPRFAPPKVATPDAPPKPIAAPARTVRRTQYAESPEQLMPMNRARARARAHAARRTVRIPVVKSRYSVLPPQATKKQSQAKADPFASAPVVVDTIGDIPPDMSAAATPPTTTPAPDAAPATTTDAAPAADAVLAPVVETDDGDVAANRIAPATPVEHPLEETEAPAPDTTSASDGAPAASVSSTSSDAPATTATPEPAAPVAPTTVAPDPSTVTVTEPALDETVVVTTPVTVEPVPVDVSVAASEPVASVDVALPPADATAATPAITVTDASSATLSASSDSPVVDSSATTLSASGFSSSSSGGTASGGVSAAPATDTTIALSDQTVAVLDPSTTPGSGRSPPEAWVTTLSSDAAHVVGVSVDGSDLVVTVDGVASSRALEDVTALTITGGPLADTFTIGASVAIPVALDGAGGADTFVGPAGDQRWSVDGPGSGSVGGVTFTGFENLSGAADNDDTFVFGGGGSVAGVVQGGPGGFDTIELAGGSYGSLVSTITGPDAGTLARDADVLTYAGFEPITVTGCPSCTVTTTGADARTITVRAGDAGKIVVEVSGGESHTFENVGTMTSLTITSGGGNDTITVQALDAAFNGTLSV